MGLPWIGNIHFGDVMNVNGNAYGGDGQPVVKCWVSDSTEGGKIWYNNGLISPASAAAY